MPTRGVEKRQWTREWQSWLSIGGKQDSSQGAMNNGSVQQGSAQ